MQKLRVFISSTMMELHNERVAIQQALEARGIEVIWFEGFGARPEAAQTAYLEGVQEADVYIGIFWNQYSLATEEEYREAEELGKPCFIYLKDFAVKRESKLQALIDELGRKHTYKPFKDALTLADQVQRDIQDWIMSQWRLGRETRGVKLPQPPILITSIESPRRDFLVQDGKRRRIPDNPTLRAVMKKLGIKEIRPFSDKEIYKYPCGDDVPSKAPEVVQDGRGIKYLVARNEKKRILNDETLKALGGGDPRHVPTKPDEYLARFQEGSPLPEEWGEQWFTSKPRLVRVEAAYTAVFLIRGLICRYIPEPAFVGELK